MSKVIKRLEMYMSVIDTINENMNIFSPQEKELAKYIIQKQSEICTYSSQLLAKKTGVSPATVIRFSKKLGYKGFSHLKLDLAKIENVEDFSASNIIKAEDSTEDLIKKSTMLHKKNLDLTAELLNPDLIRSATTELHKAKGIYLVGVGGSGNICEDFRLKLSKIHKNVYFHLDINSMLTQLSFIGKDDVMVAISYSGNTAEVNACVEIAKSKNAKVISITSKDKNKLSKLSDIPIFIPKDEDEASRLGSIYSRFSSLFITDILYYGVAKESIEETHEKIRLTSQTDTEFAKYLQKNSIVRNK